MKFNNSLISTILSIFIVNTYYNIVVCEDILSSKRNTKTVPTLPSTKSKLPPNTNYTYQWTTNAPAVTTTSTATATIITRTKTVPTVKSKVVTTSPVKIVRTSYLTVPPKIPTFKTIPPLDPLPNYSTTASRPLIGTGVPNPFTESEIEVIRTYCDGDDSLFINNLYNYICLREVVTVNEDGEYDFNYLNDYRTAKMPCLVYDNRLYCIDNTVFHSAPCQEGYATEVSLDRCLVFIAHLLDTTIYELVRGMPEFTNRGRSFVNPNRPNWYPE